jgi:DnaK suppressor protein
MATGLKPDELDGYRNVLLNLRARLCGDLDQMTDEALRRKPESSGNLSNVPLHMADVGTENYDQEFTLGLIENEQATLDQVQTALNRLDAGSYGKCLECGEAIARQRLQYLPYAKLCIQCARKQETGA